MSQKDFACPQCGQISFLAYHSPNRGEVWFCIDCKVDNNCSLRWTNESARLWENEESSQASSQSVKVTMGSDVEPELFNWKRE